MALPPLADLQAFKAWPGVTVDAGQAPAAEAVLGFVSARVRSLAGRTWADDAGETLVEVPEVIPGLVVVVAARVWANPEAKQVRTVGPYTDTFDTSRLFTDEELAEISRAATGGASPFGGISTIPTTRGELETPDVCDPHRDLTDWRGW